MLACPRKMHMHKQTVFLFKTFLLERRCSSDGEKEEQRRKDEGSQRGSLVHAQKAYAQAHACAYGQNQHAHSPVQVKRAQGHQAKHCEGKLPPVKTEFPQLSLQQKHHANREKQRGGAGNQNRKEPAGEKSSAEAKAAAPLRAFPIKTSPAKSKKVFETKTAATDCTKSMGPKGSRTKSKSETRNAGDIAGRREEKAPRMHEIKTIFKSSGAMPPSSCLACTCEESNIAGIPNKPDSNGNKGSCTTGRESKTQPSAPESMKAKTLSALRFFESRHAHVTKSNAHPTPGARNECNSGRKRRTNGSKAKEKIIEQKKHARVVFKATVPLPCEKSF